MPRPFIFLATPDPEFERLAIDAILSTRHGVRRVRNLEAAGQSLAAGANDLSLAVVDVTHHGFGEQLLAVLNGLSAEFPILAITDDENGGLAGMAWSGLAITTLAKANAPTELARRLRERIAAGFLCAA